MILLVKGILAILTIHFLGIHHQGDVVIVGDFGFLLTPGAFHVLSHLRNTKGTHGVATFKYFRSPF